MRLIFIFLLLFVTAAHGQVAKSLTTKTAPTGNKITYSDNAMDALDRGEVVPTRVLDTNKQLADTQPPGSSRFVWPTQGKVISTFDPTRKGIDIAGKDGQPVVAASDGKVLYAKNMRGYGNLIIIEHRDGMVTAYAHNKAILVREGQTVTQRQQIAEMGDSDADSVKLRFQIRHMGKPIDPLTLLPSQDLREEKIVKKDLNNPNSLALCSKDQKSRYHNCWGTEQIDGDNYVGEFRDDKRNGQGTYTWANGDKYAGEFKDDMRDGRGTSTFANGDLYVGEFKDNKKNGEGTFTSAGGNKYMGEFKDDLRHGRGTLSSADGSKYVGQFKNNMMDGQGTHQMANGEKYVGEFRYNRRHGHGVLTYVGGDKYVGEFKDDNRNGQGTLDFADGDTYVGTFKDNKFHGQGIFTQRSGSRHIGEYVGEFKDGKRYGQGTLTLVDGGKYVGEFKDNKFHGQGISTKPDGSQFEVVYENGKLIRESQVNVPTVTNKAATNTDQENVENEHPQISGERGRSEEKSRQQAQVNARQRIKLDEKKKPVTTPPPKITKQNRDFR
jgi:hypothetical protein